MPVIHRRSAPVLLLVALTLVASGSAIAASPFGVGLPEPAPTGGGFLPDFFGQLAAWQSSFYRKITASLKAMKADGTAAIWLAALSFGYGVIHALGPGHGKAIVSAYVLANRETARNGAILALVSAFAQGVTAVTLVSVAAILLGATSIAMTRAAEWFEIGSFALLTGLGAVLVWRKALRPLLINHAARYAPVPVGALALAGHQHEHGQHHGHDHGGHHGGGHDHSPDGHRCEHGPHDHHTHGIDCGCGHAHVPSPDLAGGRLDWSKAWTTALAVGLRPCTGALIVLVFSLSQGLFFAGVVSTFAMAFGTGLTVAALTLGAVVARGTALRVSGDGVAGHRVHSTIEAAAATAVLLFGLLMLGASLS